MIIRKYCLLLLSVMLLPQAMASNNSSSEIHMAASPVSSGAVVQHTGRNPFTGDTYHADAPSAPPLVIQEDKLLSQEIRKWVEANGYKLFWNSAKDYLVYNNITLAGKSDDEILQELGELFFSENYGLVVKKYQKNRVIVIDEM